MKCCGLKIEPLDSAFWSISASRVVDKRGARANLCARPTVGKEEYFLVYLLSAEDQYWTHATGFATLSLLTMTVQFVPTLWVCRTFCSCLTVPGLPGPSVTREIQMSLATLSPQLRRPLLPAWLRLPDAPYILATLMDYGADVCIIREEVPQQLGLGRVPLSIKCQPVLLMPKILTLSLNSLIRYPMAIIMKFLIYTSCLSPAIHPGISPALRLCCHNQYILRNSSHLREPTATSLV